jgi:23S rRNA pseudouridine955/2504/2580 synthase/23S rRNA pseudouridine1911/1915/1917 synthase
MSRRVSIDIIYQDLNIIAINKPAGLLSIPPRYDEQTANAKELLEHQQGPLYVLHRLDRQTSGVLLFAKNANTHKALSGLFESREINKKYIAICFGIPLPKESEINLPIREMNNKRGKYQVHPNGKEAISNYRVIEEFRHYSLLELDLITGRTHQIRVHLKAIGYPLLVDDFYGYAEAFYLSEVKKKKYNLGRHHKEMPLFSRSSLHAHKLSFVYPGKQDILDITAPLPKDFKACLNQLRKWNKK